MIVYFEFHPHATALNLLYICMYLSLPSLFLCRPMYVRQLARKKIKLETSSSSDTSSSLASSSSSSPSAASSLVLTASSGSGGGRSSLTSSPAKTKKSPARKDVGARGGGPVLTHTPVGSALRLAKGRDGAGLGVWSWLMIAIIVLAFVFELHNRSTLLNSVFESLRPLSHSISCPLVTLSRASINGEK